MRQVSFETTIAMSRAEAWEKLRDLLIARHYVPGVTNIEYNTEQHEGVGASRKVYMKGQKPVDETVIDWEDGHGFTIRLHQGDKPAAPFKEATFRYRIDDTPDGQTLFKGIISYEVGMGLIGKVLDALVVHRMMLKTNEALKNNVKIFYETGKTANPALASA